MKKNIFSVVFFALLFCAPLTTNAQQQIPRTISGGVLNGKAISLPKPAYPQIARAARAGGTVVVQVTIGEDGSVISAEAISGHPLLKAAAVQAAQGAKFSPTLLQGTPVKVTGTINYNFMLAMSWVDVGAALSNADKDITYRSLPSYAGPLASQEFESERKELQELQQTPVKSENELKAETSIAKQDTSPTNKGVYTIVGTKAEPVSREDYSKRLSSVIESIKNKLTGDGVKSWYFSLGLIIGKTKDSLNSDAEIREAIENFRNHASIAPTGVSDTIISRIQNIVSLSNKSSFDEANKNEINRLIQEILTAPIEKY